MLTAPTDTDAPEPTPGGATVSCSAGLSFPTNDAPCRLCRCQRPRPSTVRRVQNAYSGSTLARCDPPPRAGAARPAGARTRPRLGTSRPGTACPGLGLLKNAVMADAIPLVGLVQKAGTTRWPSARD